MPGTAGAAGAATPGTHRVPPGAVPPVIVVGHVDSVLTLTFTAEAGRTYRLLNSSNFIDWSAVATNSPLAPGVVQFVTPISSVPTAFFRVVTP